MRELPVWRSLLYVPVHVEKFVARAHTRGADCVQLDLEDSVPAGEKKRARSLLASAAARVRQSGADVIVRINRPLDLAVRDIEFAIGPDVDGISVPKVDSAGHLRLLDELVSDLELRRGLPAGHTRLIGIIETLAAFFDLNAIVRATPRLVAVTLGGEDFALDAGMQPDADTLLVPKQQVILAARSADLMPLGFLGSVATLGDWEAFRAMVRRSRRFGFMGASCVHPGQVSIVNEEYSPSADEVAHARSMVDAAAKAEAEGRGAFALDGRMIDQPIVDRARHVLARHAAIARREARLRAIT